MGMELMRRRRRKRRRRSSLQSVATWLLAAPMMAGPSGMPCTASAALGALVAGRPAVEAVEGLRIMGATWCFARSR